MPVLNISITDDQDQFVGKIVAAGRYPDANEVVREGLRLLERREAREAAKLARFHMLIAEGDAAHERGEYDEVPLDRIGEWLENIDIAEREAASH